MAPPLGNSSFGSFRPSDIDAIDLTLSSPEPEQRPRLPAQQQRLPTYFKAEARDGPTQPRRIKDEQTASLRVPQSSQSHARAIDPNHLANIVQSTDYQIVENLLLELCRQSPALSGAVARGLARHSTFAQSLIKKHRPRPQASGSRQPARDHLSEGEGARERLKQRLAASIAASRSQQSQAHTPSTVAGAQSARPPDSHNARSNAPRNTHPAGSQSALRIKRERQPDLGESDSDLDQYIPRDFPINSQQATPTRLPLREVSSARTAVKTPTSYFLSRPVTGFSERHDAEPTTKSCIQCREEIEEDDEGGLCFFHAGPMRIFRGKLTCDQCNKASHQPGCELGTHVTKPRFDTDALKRYSSKRSQSPSKRARVA